MLLPDEPPPFESVEPSGNIPVMLVCDHASCRVPKALDQLGVPTARLREHIGWDIGAAAVARVLQARFGAGAVFANYSRLVVDLNRSLADGSAFPAISDGTLVPGNIGIPDSERRRRAEALFHPYHEAIEQLVSRLSTPSRVPVFLGIHSFTPSFHGTPRPWHIGLLWDKDPRLALPLLRYLRGQPGLVIGDNDPYSGRHPADYSIDFHAERTGLAHVGIEIRQDLISDVAGQQRLAGIVGDALAIALRDSRVFERRSPPV